MGRLFRRSVPAGCPTGAPRRLLRPDHPTGTTQWKASRVRCGRCYRFGYLSSVLKFRIIEAAEILGVSDDTVRRWIDNGQLLVERDQSRRMVIDGAGKVNSSRRAAEPGTAPSATADSETRCSQRCEPTSEAVTIDRWSATLGKQTPGYSGAPRPSN